MGYGRMGCGRMGGGQFGHRSLETTQEERPKVLRMDQETFAESGARLSRLLAEEYRSDLEDKGLLQEASKEQVDALMAEKQREVIAEMAQDYCGEVREPGVGQRQETGRETEWGLNRAEAFREQKDVLNPEEQREIVTDVLQDYCEEAETLDVEGKQEAEQTSETEPEQAGEAETEQTSETEPERAGEAESEQTLEAEPEQAGEAETEQTSETEPERTGEAESEQTLEAEPERAGEAESEQTLEAEPERAGEAESEQTLEAEPERAGEAESEQTSETEPERTGEAESEQTSETEPERAGEAESEQMLEQDAKVELVEAEEVASEQESDMASDKYLFGFGKREIQETDENVKRRLEQCGVRKVELDGVLERHQEMIACNVEEMCESYPELQGYIGNIRAEKLRDGVFACAGPRMEKDGYCAEILINSDMFERGDLESRIAKLETTNWKGETYLAGHGKDAILKHEMAHILHLRMLAEESGLTIGSHDKEAFQKVLDQYNKNLIVTKICYETWKEQEIPPNEWARHLSIYGAHDFGECFAEAIAEYETSKHPRKFATEVYNKYQRRIRENDDYTA